MSEPKKMILDTDPEAAVRTTVTLWKSVDGRLFSEERDARYNSCTHRACQTCGKPAPKHYIYCDACLSERQVAKYFELPEADSVESLVYCESDETYYHGLEELFDSWDSDDVPMVVNCEPQYAPGFDIDNFLCDCLAEDAEPPDELVQAANAFNEAVKAYAQPLCFYPGKTRVRQSLLVEMLGERSQP